MIISSLTTTRVMFGSEEELLVPFGSGEMAKLSSIVIERTDGDDEPSVFVHGRRPLKSGGYRQNRAMWGVDLQDLPPEVLQALAVHLVGRA